MVAEIGSFEIFKITTLKYGSFRLFIYCAINTSPRRNPERQAGSLSGRLFRRRLILPIRTVYLGVLCRLCFDLALNLIARLNFNAQRFLPANVLYHCLIAAEDRAGRKGEILR